MKGTSATTRIVLFAAVVEWCLAFAMAVTFLQGDRAGALVASVTCAVLAVWTTGMYAHSRTMDKERRR